MEEATENRLPARFTASYRKHKADLLRSIDEALDQHARELGREAGLPSLGKRALDQALARLMEDLAPDYDGATALWSGERGYTLFQAAKAAVSWLRLCARDHEAPERPRARRRPGAPPGDLEGDLYEIERAIDRAYRTRKRG